MVLLTHDQFLSRLTLMFDKARSKGHVTLVMKRYDGRVAPRPKDPSKQGRVVKSRTSLKTKSRIESSRSSSEVELSNRCLIRANFKNEKISVVVMSGEVSKFQSAYCNLLKSQMDGLKRQKKVKAKKTTTQE